MNWTTDDKRQAAFDAPRGITLWREDTRVIERPGWYQLITPSAPGSLNEVIISQVAEDDAEDVIDETIAQYRAIGQRTKWCVGPWTKPDQFGERLTRRGFRSWDVCGMACDTSIVVDVPPDVRVHKIDDRSVDRWVGISMRGWEIAPSYARGEQAAVRRALRDSPAEFALFSASIGEEWLGTAALIIRNNYGYFYATQVLQEARGRGVYRALIAGRLRFLAQRGIDLAVTHARAATSASALRRVGFETVFESRCFKLDQR